MNNLFKHLLKFALVGIVLLGFLPGSKYLIKYYSINENLTPVEKAEVQNTPDEQAVESIFYEVQEDNQNAFELLKANEEIEYKEYEFGVFVESINGIFGDDRHFWALYINNEQSMTGADQTIVNKGDTLEWLYEEIK